MVFLALLTFPLLLGKVNTSPRERISSEKQSAGKKRFFGEKSVDRWLVSSSYRVCQGLWS